MKIKLSSLAAALLTFGLLITSTIQETTLRQPAQVNMGFNTALNTNYPPISYEVKLDKSFVLNLGGIIHESLREGRTVAGFSRNAQRVDLCNQSGGPALPANIEKSFAEVISEQVTAAVKTRNMNLKEFKKLRFEKGEIPVSLMSHEFCKMTERSFRMITRQDIDEETLKMVNLFSKEMNYYRLKGITNDTVDGFYKKLFAARFAQLMMCVPKHEGLTTAGENGINVTFDSSQHNKRSKKNIGLFQLSPDPGGETYLCFKQWNQLHPNCAIDENVFKPSKLVISTGIQQIISSPMQTFNAFCGINDMLKTFSIQVNSESPQRTHFNNRNATGAVLKPAALRCVTPFSGTIDTWNAKGVLQNTTGDNLREIMDCMQTINPQALANMVEAERNEYLTVKRTGFVFEDDELKSAEDSAASKPLSKKLAAPSLNASQIPIVPELKIKTLPEAKIPAVIKPPVQVQAPVTAAVKKPEPVVKKAIKPAKPTVRAAIAVKQKSHEPEVRRATAAPKSKAKIKVLKAQRVEQD